MAGLLFLLVILVKTDNALYEYEETECDGCQYQELKSNTSDCICNSCCRNFISESKFRIIFEEINAG